jgi:hypothetical protein
MVDFWMSFADYPTARAWYRAHNGSVVAAYLERRDLAEAENEAERFFMNVVLCRVLYATPSSRPHGSHWDGYAHSARCLVIRDWA